MIRAAITDGAGEPVKLVSECAVLAALDGHRRACVRIDDLEWALDLIQGPLTDDTPVPADSPDRLQRLIDALVGEPS